jgi:hypothetical protein
MYALRGITAVAFTLCLAGPLAAQAHSHDHASPYSGFTDRDIKALSAEEVDGLLSGAGLGMALPGELNGYPGPRHVLDMAPMLGLAEDQVAAIRGVFEEMETEARSVGARIVELERVLDRAFADGTITEAQLAEWVREIAAARADLRIVHLRAHLRLKPLLTEDQIEHYQRARGYTR